MIKVQTYVHIFFIIIALASLAACGKKEAVTHDDMDLSDPGDLFSNPVRSPSSQVQPVAVLNGESIGMEEVDRELQTLLTMTYRRAITPEFFAEQKNAHFDEVLEAVIARKLLEAEAGRLSLVVTDEEVSEAIARASQMLPTGVTMDTMLQSRGMTIGQLRSNITREILVNKLIELKMTEAPAVSQEEMRAFYTNNTASFKQKESVLLHHIFKQVKPDYDEMTTTKLRLQMEEARQQLLEGVDFAEVAKAYSDHASKEQGGRLGKIARGQMPEPIEEVVFSQEPGVIGEIIEMAGGMHMFRVDERTPEHVLSFDEAQERIEGILNRERRNQIMQQFVTDLREKADLQITPQP